MFHSLFQTLWHSLYRIFLSALNTLLYFRHPSLLFLELFYFAEEILSFFLVTPFILIKKVSIPTYGTLPFYTLKKVQHLLSISKETSILDLGSGKGKLLLYYSLCHGCRCIGIESFSYFYRLSTFLSRLLFQNKRITWVKQDFFSYSPTSSYDIAFISALDHSERSLKSLIQQFHPHVYTFISLGAPLPSLDHCSVSSYKLPCSWGISSLYIYKKNYV